MLAWLMNMGFAGGGTVTNPTVSGRGCTEAAEVFVVGQAAGMVYNPTEASEVFVPGAQASQVVCC